MNPSNLLKTPDLPQWGGGQKPRGQPLLHLLPHVWLFIMDVMDEFAKIAKVGALARPVHKVPSPALCI